MTQRRSISWMALLCLASLAVLVGGWAQQPGNSGNVAPGNTKPRITKIEPPNWWIGLPNPMVLLTGEHLDHAQVSPHTSGIRVARTLDGLNGQYLFVWLEIADTALPATILLEVKTAEGSHMVEIPLARRNPQGANPVPNGGFNGFGPQDVIYLIMPDRFDDGDPGNNFPNSGTYDRSAPRAYHGGDLRGIQDRLPYLKDLGITTLWLTPIYDNEDRTGRDYHGYGAIDLYAVEERLGTLADYVALVQAAHSQGMKVLLDIVPNHIGPTHPWAARPPTLRWLHGSREHHLTASSPFARLTDPHSSPREWRDVVEGWFANVLPDMGTDDPLVSQYLRQNALWWAETGAIDGFRLDTFPYVDRPFWRDFHAALHQSYPDFRTVGEVFDPDPSVTSYFVGGRTTEGVDSGLDTVFDFPLYAALRKVILEDAPAKTLEEVLRHDWMFPHPENLVTFLGNHDTKRFMSERGATPRKLELALSLLMTLRGIPEIYSGDEIGMPGGDDPDNRRDFPGGFPGDRRNAFTAEGRTPEEQAIFSRLRSLLHLRQRRLAFRQGRYVHLFSDDQTMAYVRQFSSEKFLMVLNNGDAAKPMALETRDTVLEGLKSLDPVSLDRGDLVPTAELSSEGKIEVVLPPRSLSIYQIR